MVGYTWTLGDPLDESSRRKKTIIVGSFEYSRAYSYYNLENIRSATTYVRR